LNQKSARFSILLVVAILGTVVRGAMAAESSFPQWPQFRGPDGNAVAVGQSISCALSNEKGVRWKVALPAGHSSPCIWNDRIFLTGHIGTTLKMMCLRRSDGQVLWERERTIPKLPTYEHVAGDPANSTPATDGRRVVFQFDDLGLVVTDLAGEVIWEKAFPSTHNPFSYGASPVLDDGSIYLNRDGSIESGLVCLDATTGKERWRAARPDAMESFCTPYVWRGGGTKQILAGGSGRLEAFNALTGDPVWHVTGLPAFVCPSPVAADGMIVFGGWTTAHVAGRSRIESIFEEDAGVSAEAMKNPTAFFAQFDANKDGRLSRDEFPKSRARDGFNFIDKNKNGFVEFEEWAPIYGEHQSVPGRNVLLGIAAGGNGDVTQSHVKWEVTKGLPYVASPLVYRGRVYLVKAGGFISCLDVKTGKAHYESERLGVAGEYYATPVAVGEHILVCAERGTFFLIKASDNLEIAARNVLGESLYATPAVVENTLYLRSDQHLWAFGE
jgi:outer membrane protein assembly factor BamB